MYLRCEGRRDEGGEGIDVAAFQGCTPRGCAKSLSRFPKYSALRQYNLAAMQETTIAGKLTEKRQVTSDQKHAVVKRGNANGVYARSK